MMDIIQKFIHLQVKEEKKQMSDGSEQVTKKKRLIFQISSIGCRTQIDCRCEKGRCWP